jgi:hypothetical protein
MKALILLFTIFSSVWAIEAGDKYDTINIKHARWSLQTALR